MVWVLLGLLAVSSVPASASDGDAPILDEQTALSEIERRADASCSADISAMVDSIKEAQYQYVAEFQIKTKLRRSITDQNEVLTCLSALNTALEQVRSQVQDPTLAQKIGTSVGNTLKGLFRLVSSAVQRGGSGCGNCPAILGVRG